MPKRAEQYHAASARAFNLSAPFYDAEHHANRVARWTRARSLAILDTAFKPGDHVLELGCGTGDEAIHLAKRGVNVVATDASPAMIRELQTKIASGGVDQGIAQRITLMVLPAGRAGELVSTIGRGTLAGAYSSFGPLNCEPSLRPIAEALAKLVRPGGRVALSLINRYCLWETAWHLATGKPKLAFRRWSGKGSATVRAQWQHERITIFYPTLGEVERAFVPHFRVVRRMALPWLLPPQYLDGLVQRAPRVFSRLAQVECKLAEWWPFYALGDHYLLELVRVDEGAQRKGNFAQVARASVRRAVRRVAKLALQWRFRGFKPGEQPSHTVKVAGYRLWVDRGVFDPSLHFTSAFLAQYLLRPGVVEQGSTVLDLGTGSGICSLAVARAGAGKVVATDVNPAAVRCATRNIRFYGLEKNIEVREGVHFEPVAGERYAFIVCNPPYFRGSPQNAAEAAYMGGQGYEWFYRFAREAHRHLMPSGRVIMVLGDAADIRAILVVLRGTGWRVRAVARRHLLVETLFVFELVERLVGGFHSTTPCYSERSEESRLLSKGEIGVRSEILRCAQNDKGLLNENHPR